MPDVKPQAQDPGEDILEMFRDRDKKRQEESSEQVKAPAPRKPAPVPHKADPVPVPHPVSDWCPVSTEKGARIHRLQIAVLIVLFFSVLSTFVWIAIQTGDMTQRLAVPIIFFCHASSAVSALVAWFKK